MIQATISIIELCRFYDVWHHPHNTKLWHPICHKGHYQLVGLKCHSPRTDCIDCSPGDILTTVVNCKADRCDALIDRTTVFGNPFKIGQHGDRAEVIQRHRSYFYARLGRDPEFKTKVLALMGQVLGCHCKPLKCHGDTIAEYLNNYSWLQQMRGNQ